MPNFANPFSGRIPDRKLSPDELIRAVRLDIAGEHEAIHMYNAHADATNNTFAKKIFINIANEERVHIGELTRLLDILTGNECTYQKKGVKEVNEMTEKPSKSNVVSSKKRIVNKNVKKNKK